MRRRNDRARMVLLYISEAGDEIRNREKRRAANEDTGTAILRIRGIVEGSRDYESIDYLERRALTRPANHCAELSCKISYVVQLNL